MQFSRILITFCNDADRINAIYIEHNWIENASKRMRTRMLILILILIFTSMEYYTRTFALTQTHNFPLKMAIVILSLKLIKNSLSQVSKSDKILTLACQRSNCSDQMKWLSAHQLHCSR